MNFKFNIFPIIMIIIISCSYFGSIFSKYSNIFDILLSLGVIFLYFYWIYKKGCIFKKNIIWINYLVFLLIIITRKPNLVSLMLMIILTEVMKDNKEINIKKYIKFSLLFFCAIVFCYLIFNFNKIYDTSIWRISTNEVVYRHSLGFTHPNQAMFKWFGIALGLLTLITNKNIYKITLLVLLPTLLIYRYTQSRTVTFVIILLIIIILIFQKKLNLRLSRGGRTFIGCLPLILLIASYLTMDLSNYSWLDKFFSGRFTLYRQYFNEVGLNLWGSSIIENNAMLDNSFLHMLLSKGLFFTIVYLFIFFNTIKKAKEITLLEAFLIIGYFIASLMETALFKFELVILVYIIIFKRSSVLSSNESVETY